MRARGLRDAARNDINQWKGQGAARRENIRPTVEVERWPATWLRQYGDPEGNLVFYFHGWPGSRCEPRLLHSVCAELQLRLVAPDRPGLGLSDFQRGRKLLDWPKDVCELADRFGVFRFTVLGVSGGGPYALACAAAALTGCSQPCWSPVWVPRIHRKACAAWLRCTAGCWCWPGGHRGWPTGSLVSACVFSGVEARSRSPLCGEEAVRSGQAGAAEQGISGNTDHQLTRGFPARGEWRGSRWFAAGTTVGLSTRGSPSAGPTLAWRSGRGDSARDGPLPGARSNTVRPGSARKKVTFRSCTTTRLRF